MPTMFEMIGFSEQGWGGALLKGLLMTLQISVGAFVVGLVVGLIVACLKLGAPKPIAVLARGYTTLFRAVPELLMILLLFYVGSMLLNSLMEGLGYGAVNVSGPLAAILVLGLVQGPTLRKFSGRRSWPFLLARSKRGKRSACMASDCFGG